MKRVTFIKKLIELTSFKTLRDNSGNEFVLFANSSITTVPPFYDRTSFESSENHVHVFHNITLEEFHILLPLASQFGNMLLSSLKQAFPEKHFMVFVSVHLNDAFTIRFHQKWPGELPFCDPLNFQNGDERVFCVEG